MAVGLSVGAFVPAAADAKKYGFSLPLIILLGTLRVIFLWLLIAAIVLVIALGLWIYRKWIRRKRTLFKYCLGDGAIIFIYMFFTISILAFVTFGMVGILSGLGIVNLEG